MFLAEPKFPCNLYLRFLCHSAEYKYFSELFLIHVQTGTQWHFLLSQICGATEIMQDRQYVGNLWGGNQHIPHILSIAIPQSTQLHNLSRDSQWEKF